MSEALERWSEHLFRQQLPRIYQIVCEINRRLMIILNQAYPGDIPKIEYMAVIANGEIRMANMCLAACHKINGVSKLHTDILKIRFSMIIIISCRISLSTLQTALRTEDGFASQIPFLRSI